MVPEYSRAKCLIGNSIDLYRKRKHVVFTRIGIHWRVVIPRLGLLDFYFRLLTLLSMADILELICNSTKLPRFYVAIIELERQNEVENDGYIVTFMAHRP
jgi:hypothetical protein